MLWIWVYLVSFRVFGDIDSMFVLVRVRGGVDRIIMNELFI